MKAEAEDFNHNILKGRVHWDSTFPRRTFSRLAYGQSADTNFSPDLDKAHCTWMAHRQSSFCIIFDQ